MAHALMLLHRLYVLDDPAWDRGAARSRVDLFELCNRIAAILEETGARRRSVGVPRSEDDMFSRLSGYMRSMRAAWGAELETADWREGIDRYRLQPGQWAAPYPDWGMGPECDSCRSMTVVAGQARQPARLMDNMPNDAWLQDMFNVSW